MKQVELFGEKILTEKPIKAEKPRRAPEGYDPLRGYPLEAKRAKQELMASFSVKTDLKEESKGKFELREESLSSAPRHMPQTPKQPAGKFFP